MAAVLPDDMTAEEVAEQMGIEATRDAGYEVVVAADAFSGYVTPRRS